MTHVIIVVVRYSDQSEQYCEVFEGSLDECIEFQERGIRLAPPPNPESVVQVNVETWRREDWERSQESTLQ